MILGSLAKRYLAIFVLAFLCLNAGGALCLTHCSLERVSAEDEFAGLSDHCKAIKLAEKADSEGGKAVDANLSICCSVPVAIVAAPIEKKIEFEKAAAAVAVPQVAYVPAIAASQDANSYLPVYRPPPLDRRVERLKHCVLLI